ncbi:biotin--[acetyl-CoA-carboxylase] ligase [Clostridium hydrogeniformans]|uniref:biotin--[acetyl-CoA-carboxylase] ligase n=1 Tax=Clostridium hydrogeniformans TaxID=349933 RepID=UPI0004825C85|nr:biotin--[acetyl-CoA-carboxylase] ligase [Clostridium hydrogeniformans]
MKYKVLELFKNNKDQYISGEDISKNIGVSRASIWKYIKALKEEGYEFESSTKVGYKLIKEADVLNYIEISPYLKTKYIGRSYYHFDTIDSTNSKAKEAAKDNLINGAVFISEEQVSGRGRLGRTWISPKHKGIWLSILLTPDLPPLEVSKTTLIGSAAVYLALKELGIESSIKWPNDIILNNKKLCGILTEISGEMNNINYMVMGIGINVNTLKEDFSEDLKPIATSLKRELKEDFNRKKLTSYILNNFEDLYDDFLATGKLNKTLDISREASILIGKEIQCINRDKSFICKAEDITEDGELLVILNDGSYKKIISGEVSIRGLYGYVE